MLYVNTYLWYSKNQKGEYNMSKIKFTTTISNELLEKIKIQAIKEHRSVSEILEELIANYLKNKTNQCDL